MHSGGAQDYRELDQNMLPVDQVPKPGDKGAREQFTEFRETIDRD